jgi:hypothetical protein
MGYRLLGVRIDFETLLGVPGSRNTTLLDQTLTLVDQLPYDLEDETADEDPALSPAEALRHLFDGKVSPDEDYSMALMVLYRRLGTVIGQIEFSSGDLGLLAEWGAAMRAAGLPSGLDTLANRGTPLEVLVGGDFPSFGYMTPAEVATTATLLEGRIAWPLIWKRTRPLPRMEPAAFAEFNSWIDAASSRGQGLVGVLF